MRKIKNKNKKVIEPQLIDDSNGYSVKSIIMIFLIMIIVFIIFYFITVKVVNNQSTDMPDETPVSEGYQTDKILFGQMLTRKENEYYVYAYDEKSKIYDLLEQYLTDYDKKENALTVYRVNLKDGMNKTYLGDKMQVNDTLDGLKVSEPTLFKIKDGKIENYYTSASDIANMLK